jgi:hypothetical protein
MHVMSNHQQHHEEISVQIIGDGADGYRLLSANNDLVGWVRGKAIGVSGLADEESIASAALRSYEALSAWLERQHLHPLPALGGDVPRWIHDGAHRWLLVGRVPVARLPPNAAGASSAHAFEIVLKGSISEGMAIHAALVALRAAHGTIDPADVAWAGSTHASGVRSSRTPASHLELEGQ